MIAVCGSICSLEENYYSLCWNYGSFSTSGLPCADCRGACGFYLMSIAWCAPASHLPRFILLVSLIDSLLVVPISDIVYDYHLWRYLHS